MPKRILQVLLFYSKSLTGCTKHMIPATNRATEHKTKTMCAFVLGITKNTIK